LKSLYEIQMELWKYSYQRWSSQELLSFAWLFNIAVIIIFYVIFVKLVDKRRLKELLLFGSLVAVCAGFIDMVGITIGLWEYKVRLFPVSTALFPFDYTAIPILYMFVLQYTLSWRNYLIGSLLASAFFSFVISPIYILIGIKQYHHFNHFYMFILVFVTTTIIKAVYNWITAIEFRNFENIG
jgi:hypothetical protein